MTAIRSGDGTFADTALERRLRAITDGFAGEVGIYVRHLRSGATVEMRADELFPTASLIKVPLLLTLYDRLESGAIDFEEEWTFRDSLVYTEYDLSAKLRDGVTVPVSELAHLMIVMSDNTAALWIQDRIGGGAAANAWLAAHGFEATRVNSRTPGREDDRERYGWGQTTPREIAGLLVTIREGRAVSPAASDQMYRTLTDVYWDDDGLSQIPPWVQAASKQGAVDRSRSEAMLVNAPSGDYVLAVITRNQEDTSYAADNAGFRLIRAVSRAVYAHFEPGDPWTPPAEPYRREQEP